MFSFCSHGQPPQEDGGEVYTLSLLEELRDEYGKLQKTYSDSYHRLDGLLRQLSNPNIHDIPFQMPFRIEMWDRHEQHIRWVIAAADTVTVAHGAFDAAVKFYPAQSWTLRNGILVIREHKPSKE
jgi:hypothetical protein